MLALYTDDVDTVVAESLEDARRVWLDAGRGDDFDLELWGPIEPEMSVSIWCDANGQPGEIGGEGTTRVTLPAREWAAKHGRGFLCTTEQ